MERGTRNLKNIRSTIPKPRIETLSDLVFGLALSISAFSLAWQPPSIINDIIIDMVSFGLSFLILISVWIRYTAIMSVLPVETNTAFFLNIILLLLVAIELYALNLIGLIGHFKESTIGHIASVIYALDMGGLMVVIAAFSHILSVEEKQLVPPLLAEKYKQIRNILLISAALFFITILPDFWVYTIADRLMGFLFWFIPLTISRIKMEWKTSKNTQP